MNGLGIVRSARCLTVWIATTLVVLAVAAWSAPDLPRAAGPAPFDRLLVHACALALVLCAAWWWGVTTLVVLEVLRSTDRARPASDASSLPGVPALARRWVLAACGIAVLSGGLSPALATPGSVQHDDSSHPDALSRAGTEGMEGLPLPDRPLGGLRRPGHDPEVAQPRGAPAPVVVRPGDSLWRIAARVLGPDADDVAVTAYWQRIHQLNRHICDPDLIRPGQRLVMPTRPTPSRGES